MTDRATSPIMSACRARAASAAASSPWRPAMASIAVWSPGLNKVGNSQLGSLALEMLAPRTGWSVFGD